MSPGRGCKAGETPVMESKDGTSMAACSGPITDWVIEYSASPCIWVCTTEAWYKLASPAAEYAATFSGAQRRLDLCTRVAAVLASKPYASLEQALPQILMHWQPASAPGLATGTGEVAGVRESGDLQQHPHHQHQDLKGRGPQGYTLDDLHAEAGFICSQLRTLLKKQKQGPALYPLLAELLNLGMPAEYGDSDDAEDDAMVCDGDEGKAACVAAVAAQKSKRWHWRKERAALEREARATNKRVDLARGNPPPPCTNFRLSHDMVPELLMIWEMIMAFSHLLQLPPIALESLEAAIMPGPLPKAKPPHPPVAAPPAGLGGSDDEEEATFGLGGPTGAADEHEFAGLGNTPRVDWAAAGRRPPGEEEWGGRVQYDLATLLDPEAGASALVLRDVHSALIKIIEGFSPKFLPDPPERARMAAEDNKSETWQECTWKTILDPKAPQELIQTGAKEAAELLKGTAEYTCLQPRQRLLILRSLLELALNSEVMRDYALQKAELISSSLPKDVTDLLPADPSDDLTELHAAQSRGAAGVPSINGWEAASPDVWLCWLQGCRVGVRRPLGTDFRKRRYWAFGGRAGCWRVFVEAPQGGGWGWYEGAALSELLDWLRAGQGLEAEAPLLRALQAMPLPMKHSEDPVPPYPLPLPPPPQGSSQPTIPWTPQDLQARRPDGYKLLAAPMLRGEYHQVLPSYGKVFNTQERILNCCQALLSELDFENRNKPWAPRIARLLCGFEARGAAGQAQGVLEVEAMLSEAGLLAPVWTGTQLQDVWRRSLSRPGLNFRDIAMHLHALQRFCRPPAPTTHPTRYHFMRHVTHLRCPVNFPSLNEPLVCLRAGCMANLDKFLDKHPKLDHPGSEVAQARQSIADLPPVQRVKIVCLGYRNYPGPNNAAPPWDNHSLKVKIEDGNHTQGAVKLEGGLEDGVKLEGQGWHEATHTTGRPGSSPFEAAQQGGSGAKLVCLGGDVHEQGHTHTHALHPPRPHSHSQQTPLPQGSGRPPCMWMVLQRMRQAEGQAPEEWVPEEGRDPVVLPIHVDASLPEFVLRPAVLEAALAKPWRVGSRVRYHHPGAKAGAKAGGAWIKGTVHHNSLLEPQLAQGGAQHDPWGSIHVVWDLKDGGTQGRVNPWELEQDPDELRRQEEERRKAEEAAARAQRAEAKGRRAGSIRIREEYLDFPSDDISSGPSEEDEDSDDSYGNRRKKNRKKPAKGARASSQQLQHQQQQQQQQQQAALLQQQQQQMLQRQPTSNAAAQLQANVVHQFRQVRDRLSQYSVVYTSMHQKGQASTPQAMQVYQALQHLQASLQSLQHQVVQVYGQHGTTMLKQLLGESAPRTQMAALAASNLTPAQQQQLLLQRQQQQQQQQQQQLTQQQLVQQQLAQQQQQQQLAHAARMQQQQLQQQRQAQLIRLQQQQQQQQQGSMYPQGLVSQGMVPQSQGLVSQGMVPQSQGLVSQGMVPQSQDFVPHSMVPQSQGLVSQGMMPKSQGLVPQSMVPQPQGFLGGPQSVLGPPQSMLPQASTAMLTPMQLIQLQQQRKQQQQQQAGTVAAHPQPQQQQMMPQSSPQPMALTPMQYQQMLLQQQQQQQQ